MVQFTEFLIDRASPTPKSLTESLRLLGNSSAGFCNSWNENDHDNALSTSEEAFGLFDHIQSELLRHRDDKKNDSNWNESTFKTALEQNIGKIVKSATEIHKQDFLNLQSGEGRLPSNEVSEELPLVMALNKLKHRASIAVNFSVSSTNEHQLYFFTNEGMRQPSSISCFNVSEFCQACKKAVDALNA